RAPAGGPGPAQGRRPRARRADRALGRRDRGGRRRPPRRRGRGRPRRRRAPRLAARRREDRRHGADRRAGDDRASPAARGLRMTDSTRTGPAPAVAGTSGRTLGRGSRWVLFFGLAIGVVVIDQLAKAAVTAALSPGQAIQVIGDYLRIVFGQNSGALFG